MIVINKKTVWRVFLAVMIILTLAFIWSNSLADAPASTEKSDYIIEIVKPILDPHEKISNDLFEKMIRKTAHFIEFSVLGGEIYLLASTFDQLKKRHGYTFLLSVGTSFACSVTDELLQLTSEGRSCQLTDMMIDLAGTVTAILLVRLIIVLHAGHIKKHG